MKAEIQWQGRMKFVATAESGHDVIMDTVSELGGQDTGTRPKELLLDGLGGCTAMDVLSILRKMQYEPESFRLAIEAKQTQDHPKVFESIHIKYIVKGNIPEEKLKRAIELSQDKYCGVSAMLRKSSTLTYEYSLEP